MSTIDLQCSLLPPQRPPTGELIPLDGGRVTYDDLYSIYIREKYELPDRWTCGFLSVRPEDAPEGSMKVSGAVVPMKRSGRGHNWKKADASTTRTFFIVIQKFNDWKTVREITTGVCQECSGHGVRPSMISIRGITYRICDHCGGSGKGLGGDSHEPAPSS